MANVNGIEVSGTTYDLEDTTARTAATSASSTATSASNLANTANTNANAASQLATTAQTTATEADEKATENATAISELQSDVETLENDALSPQSLSQLSITLNSDYSAAQSIIDSLVQVGKVLTGQLIFTNIAGPNIGTITQAKVGLCSLHPHKETYAVGIDYSSGAMVRVQILNDGEVRISESLNVTNGTNSIRIPFTMIV